MGHTTKQLLIFQLDCLFNNLGGLRPPRWLNKTVSLNRSITITYFFKTNFTFKNSINFKTISDRDRNCLIGQKYFIHTSQSRARIRKLPVHDHMTHMVKIDILTGHAEIGNIQFILKIIFHCIFIEKPCIFSNLYNLF